MQQPLKFFVESDKKALLNLGAVVDELEITTAVKKEIETKLNKNNNIFVCGGNTFYLLQKLKRNKTDELIKGGKIYAGTSAGSIIMVPNIEYIKYLDKMEIALELKNYKALNIIKSYPLPL